MAVIGASILILLPSQIREIPGLQTQMSPAFIPMITGIGLILSGLGLILRSSFSGEQPSSVDWDRAIAVRVVTTVLLLIAYTMLFPIIGFVVTSAVFVAFFTWFFGSRDPVKTAALVVLTPIGVWLFFEKLFRIPLPHGFLF